ncbi:hypothetical protein ENBRE01_2008 [Enteropsectra breve]|nr:hypothetical protein ENBRE01_2008 [Enteropsectra breve]
MARFFQNLEEEKKDTKRKTFNEEEETYSKVSKQDKKAQELETRVCELLEANKKNFDKLYKKLMGDMKKYAGIFENGHIPEYLQGLFSDERVACNKQHRAASEEFLSLYQSKTVGSEELKGMAKGKKNASNRSKLDHILGLADLSEKKARLEEMEGLSAEESAQVAIALFTIYFRERNAEQMIAVLHRNIENFKNENYYSKIVVESIDGYLTKIQGIVNDAPIYKQYEALLNELLVLNRPVLELKILEFKFFLLNLNPSNTDRFYSLLSLVRAGDYGAAKEYFEKIRTELLAFPRSYFVNIAHEFAVLAARNSDFYLAFETLLRCNEAQPGAFTTLLYALCVVLNFRIRENAAFSKFLDAFVKFDANFLVLRSSDPVEEIFRAFYLLNMLDIEGAAKILKETCGFECAEMLEKAIPYLL